ncbi:MAG TPA: outer membrane beta-barrel family protein, partial [Flavobacterium sp.]
IINNPSSKYEANGRVVVLITRKLSRKEGYKIMLSETVSFKKEFNNYSGVNASIKRKRTEVKGSFYYNLVQPWEGAASTLVLPEENIATSSDAMSLSRTPQFTFSTGLYHQINDDDYLSISANARMQDDSHYNRFETYFKQAETEQNIITKSDNDGSRKYFNSFINYNKKLKSINSMLFTGLQYSGFRQISLSEIRNSFDGGVYAPAQDSDQRFKVDAFSGRADFEKTFKNGMKWEIGGLYLSAKANTNFQIENYESSTSMQTEYNFKEKNLSAYTQLSGKIKQLTYAAGLRSETTDIKGGYMNSADLLVDKYYTNLFPKVQLDYSVDSTHTISVNYAKSISRPNYSSTSQVTVYNSPYMVFTRNINLDPAIADEVFANYQYKDYSFKMSYTVTTNPTYFTYSYDAAKNLFNFSSINLKKESTYILETTLPFSYKAWSSTTMLAGVINKVEDDAAILNAAKPYGYFYTNHTFKLPKEYSFMISAWGVTHRQEGVYDKNAFSSVELSASKTFFGALDCSISFSDIFRGMTFEDKYTRNNIITSNTFYTDSHEFVISLKYNFGKIKDSSYKERKVDEGNRVN